MGKNLHYQIIKFFQDRMAAHNEVGNCRLIPHEDEVIFEISRVRFGDTIKVWLADQYDFSEGDFLNKPKEISRGDYILVARPEAHCFYGSDAYSQIGVGKLRDFMGALNKEKIWTYAPPTEEELKERAERKKRFR